ncbi:MAG TPA: peptide chain release factor N(5)-glutamine methyltransferase [Longimicrobiales bacterium]
MADTPLELARAAADYMAERGLENARLEAELLLASVLGLSRLELYLQHDRPLTAEEKEAFRARVRRRLKREPLQYIVGEAQFRELRLRVDPRVLIPRPETEVLVGEVLKWASARAGDGADSADGLSAVDIGTGSGAIALSLAKEGPFARVVATDVSADALEVARENARRLELDARVEFRHGALWDALRPGERFDVVVSNPPYVAEAERASLAPEVAEWEPAQALFASGGGLDVIAALVDGAPDRLRPGGLLALEIGLGQAEAVVERIERRGAYGRPRVVKDLAGRERVVLAEAGPLA